MTAFSGTYRLWEGVQNDPAIAGNWGTPLSENFALIEEATGGSGSLVQVSVAGVTSHSLTTVNGADDEARPLVQQYVGALPANCTITLPNVRRTIGFAVNSTTGGFSIILSAGSGTTLVVPPDGAYHWYAADGAGNVFAPALVTGSSAAGGASFTTGTFSSNVLIGGSTQMQGLFATTGVFTGGVLVEGLLTAAAGLSTTLGAFSSGVAITAGGLSVAGLAQLNGGLSVTGSTSFSGSISASGYGAVNGTTGNFSGAVSGTTGTFSGAVSAASYGAVNATTGSFSGAVSAPSYGNVNGASATFGGAVFATAYTATSGGANITGGINVTGTGTFSDTVVLNVPSVGSVTLQKFGNAIFDSSSGNTFAWCQFKTNGTLLGSITNNNNAGTNFNTTSDARLKVHQSELGGAEATRLLMGLIPRWFHWKDTGELAPGFFAQQVLRWWPWAVTKGRGRIGSKKFVPWQMDNSKLVPLLTAALQDALRRIDVLEKR